ncbi:DUF2863 family protein [Zwartia panacis]|jgi:hypothetical protein|uniref:DUF2863 family protein n=1 Tax=Zwartia panacis TaxID=2683345 RepID=UPI0025B4FE01|nr:DUF2863 family protein [Zwartia panacis]MDN4015579.1 DUF2863 family protein [Zwartia panacis]
MARLRSTTPSTRLTRDAARLVALALALHSSGSRVEDRYWEAELANVLLKLMRNHHDGAIDAALEHLSQTHLGGYEVLIEQAETLSESCVIEQDGKRFDVLLLVAPLVAWTRYSIPASEIPTAPAQALREHLQRHVLARDTQVALFPHLASLDQMPRTFCETWDWLQKLGLAALGASYTAPTLNSEPEAFNMLADTRYLVAAIAVPEGQPLFRWQEEPGELGVGRESCLERWIADTTPIFANLLPGCGFEILTPDAYYVSNRDADRRVRPLSVKAAVSWLGAALNIEASKLRAVIAGCGERRIDEYRIGFTQKNQNEVVYGCLWPLYGREDDQPLLDHEPPPIETIDEIANLLKECGVSDIRRLPGILMPEFCEDCGAPYFPNPNGEMVHAELPEDAETAPAHFH